MIYVFEDHYALDLEPLALTWATFELRCGALTHLERIRRVAGGEPITLIVRPGMAAVVQDRHPDRSAEPRPERDEGCARRSLPVNPEQVEAGLWLNGAALWDETSLKTLRTGHSHMMRDGRLVGGSFNADEGEKLRRHVLEGAAMSFSPTDLKSPRLLRYLWDHFLANAEQLAADFDRWCRDCVITSYPEGVAVVGDGGVCLGKDVTIDPFVVLDTREGPICIDEGTTVGSHSVITGPCYIGPKCRVWPFSLLREVSLGPVCRVMGRVEGTIMQGYSNKQHYGFLGHAYLGSWVNLAAGTTNSDLKNNYGVVKVTVNGRVVSTGSRFVGCFIGDHAKTAIGTLLNAGTRVGVAANIFGQVTPPKVVPSFAWGGNGSERYDLEKCLETMAVVKGRRGQELTEAERELFRRLYEEGE